jgi:hypothetical protein
MEHRAFVYEQIPVERLSATDLREEAQQIPAPQAFLVTLLKSDGYLQTNTDRPEVLYSSHGHRMGIAWGTDATWADVDDVESGIDMFLNDEERWLNQN